MQLTDRDGLQRRIMRAQFVTLCATSLVGCPAFLSDDWRAGSPQPTDDAAGGTTDAIAAEGGADAATSGADAASTLPLDSSVASAPDSPSTLPDSQVPDPDATVQPPPPADTGPTCTPLVGLGNNFLDCSQLSGGVYFDVDEVGDGCILNRTPTACQCAETFTCACILTNPTPYGAPVCVSNNYTFQSCTIQSNGVPLVSCQ